nr:MAG TPA: hypothetical protein [Caudoviricetes sp.]
MNFYHQDVIPINKKRDLILINENYINISRRMSYLFLYW